MKVSTHVNAVCREGSLVRVLTDGVELRVLFLTDDIVRIRAGFDGDFAEESYTLVTTAWEDRLDDFMKGIRKRIEPAAFTLEENDKAAVLQLSLIHI